MHQFFVTGEQEGRAFITITGQDAHHIKHVLRMKPGEVVRVSGECGSYTCSVLELGEDFVQLDILGEANETELSRHKKLMHPSARLSHLSKNRGSRRKAKTLRSHSGLFAVIFTHSP